MFKQINLSVALFAVSLSSALAWPYYGAISYVDSELDDLDSNGYAVTIGRNVDYGYLTAVQLTYADHGDEDFLNDDGKPRNAEVTTTEIAAIFSVSYGQLTPFLAVGYENTDLDISGSEINGSDPFSVTIDDDGFFYGVGVDYAISDKVGIRLELTYDEFTDDEGEDLDIETTRLGIVRQF